VLGPFGLFAAFGRRLTGQRGEHFRKRAANYLGARDFNGYHAAMAASYLCPVGKDVLVIGCNRGEDCRYFVEFGARRVVGIDPMDEIGAVVQARNVAYVRGSAEAMPFCAHSFDVVFAVATLEHVPSIEAAFAEMRRVSRAGALIYAASAPLWNARSGPHWGDAFRDYPWIHLRTDVGGVLAYNAHHRIFSDAQVEYYLRSPHFNRRWAKEYLAAGASVSHVAIIRNDIELEDERDVAPGVVEELMAKGYDEQELFGLTHIFIARALKGELTP
jgi:SAM-dependent methyltransferase